MADSKTELQKYQDLYEAITKMATEVNLAIIQSETITDNLNKERLHLNPNNDNATRIFNEMRAAGEIVIHDLMEVTYKRLVNILQENK